MWSPPGVDPGTAARAVAVLLVASLAGRAFQRLRLPRISGYLLTGAALGRGRSRCSGRRTPRASRRRTRCAWR